jgi:hypothetical protein
MLIDAGLFDRIHPKECFGMHNWPSVEIGKAVCREGALMAALRNCEIIVHGAGGHGSMPHLNIDPIVCAAVIIQSLQTVVSRNVNPLDSGILSINMIEGGSPVNRVADQVHKLAAKYEIDLPEGTDIYGVPEIHLRLSSEIQDYEGLMITAVLADTADDGSSFDAYMLKDVTGRKLPVRAIGEYEGGSAWGSSEIVEYVQDSTEAKVISYGWTDLTNPGCGYDSSDYTTTLLLSAGEFYDYTIYMLPTAYTVRPGHHLKLILTTWDPYRAFLDESFEKLDLDKDAEEIDYDYSYIVDNQAVHVRMPVAE